MVKPYVQASRERHGKMDSKELETRTILEVCDCPASDHDRDVERRGFEPPSPGERSRGTARRCIPFNYRCRRMHRMQQCRNSRSLARHADDRCRNQDHCCTNVVRSLDNPGGHYGAVAGGLAPAVSLMRLCAYHPIAWRPPDSDPLRRRGCRERFQAKH